MATYNLGRFILNPMGNYSSSTTYNKLDVVLYNGSSYICKSNNVIGIAPIMTNTWQLLAIGSGTATITIQQGGNNVGSFGLNDTTNTTINIPNNTLTIQKNGTTVATYTPRGNATANITVPVSSSDLADAAHIKTSEKIITPDTMDGDNELLVGDGHILKVQPNTIYVTKTLSNFSIETLDFTDEQQAYMMENFKSYVMLDVDRDFDIRLPQGYFLCGSPRLERGYRYILTIQGQFFKIDRYEDIQ